MATVHPMPSGVRRKPGRQPKTAIPRRQIPVRQLPSQHDHIEAIANGIDVPVGDYIAYVLAIAHGLEVPEYLRHIPDLLEGKDIFLQDSLPLASQA